MDVRNVAITWWVPAKATDKATHIGVDQPKSDDRTAIIVDLEIPRVELGDPTGGAKRE
jgi:hypothetical protein